MGETCAFEGCGKKKYCKGYCSGHDAQRRRGKPLTPLKAPGQKAESKFCTFEGCENKWASKGLCTGHLAQQRNGQELKPLGRRPAVRRDELGRKHCSRCDTWKSEDSFYPRKDAVDGLTHNCKRCNRDVRLLDKYGITVDEYDRLLANQNGICRICNRTEEEVLEKTNKSFAVDHDHSCCPTEKTCGKCIRGLLCHGCNTAIGHLEDDADRLMSAVAYLMSFKNVLQAPVSL